MQKSRHTQSGELLNHEPLLSGIPKMALFDSISRARLVLAFALHLYLILGCRVMRDYRATLATVGPR
jgi:hypothetical protein